MTDSIQDLYFICCKCGRRLDLNSYSGRIVCSAEYNGWVCGKCLYKYSHEELKAMGIRGLMQNAEGEQ